MRTYVNTTIRHCTSSAFNNIQANAQCEWIKLMPCVLPPNASQNETNTGNARYVFTFVPGAEVPAVGSS